MNNSNWAASRCSPLAKPIFEFHRVTKIGVVRIATKLELFA